MRMPRMLWCLEQSKRRGRLEFLASPARRRGGRRGAAETGAAAAQPLARLASPTSAQAEFLRCLRALDYLYIGK